MTDNEIIKALECCVNWDGTTSCADCPLHNTGCIHFNKLQEALDLINRQKAEIERLREALTESNEHLEEGVELAKQTLDMVMLAVTDVVKKFANELKAQFEHLMYVSGDEVKSRIDNLAKEKVGDTE